MKKAVVLALMLFSFFWSERPVFADGMDPELEIFEDPAYVKKYYDTLSVESKQRYILDLSDKYREMKERYDREHAFSRVSNY